METSEVYSENIDAVSAYPASVPMVVAPETEATTENTTSANMDAPSWRPTRYRSGGDMISRSTVDALLELESMLKMGVPDATLEHVSIKKSRKASVTKSRKTSSRSFRLPTAIDDDQGPSSNAPKRPVNSSGEDKNTRSRKKKGSLVPQQAPKTFESGMATLESLEALLNGDNFDM